MKAFTLIETVMYIALLALLMQGALAGVIAIQNSEGRNGARVQELTGSEYLSAKIEYELSHAKSVTEPAEGASASDMRYTDEDGMSVHVFPAGTNLMIARGTGLVQSLSDSDTAIAGATFSGGGMEGSSTEPAYIEFSFQFESGNGVRLENRAHRLYRWP